MDIRKTPVKLQEVDKPVEVAKLFNEVFAILSELTKVLPKAAPKEEPKKKPKKKG